VIDDDKLITIIIFSSCLLLLFSGPTTHQHKTASMEIRLLLLLF